MDVESQYWILDRPNCLLLSRMKWNAFQQYQNLPYTSSNHLGRTCTFGGDSIFIGPVPKSLDNGGKENTVGCGELLQCLVGRGEE